jgi:hypothetical protein
VFAYNTIRPTSLAIGASSDPGWEGYLNIFHHFKVGSSGNIEFELCGQDLLARGATTARTGVVLRTRAIDYRAREGVSFHSAGIGSVVSDVEKLSSEALRDNRN